MSRTASQEDIAELVLLNQVEVTKKAYAEYGGPEGVAALFGTDPVKGLSNEAVLKMREKYGKNEFPEAPLKAYYELLFEAFQDTTLLILLVAATVSLIVGFYEDAKKGWIEGVAIYIAVILVSNIGAMNDYSKQLQFAELERTAAGDDLCTVIRNKEVLSINPSEVVVGDLLSLNQGDAAPADCVLISKGTIYSNQSSLTGESDDLKKSAENDAVIYSSCTVPKASSTAYAIAIGIGPHSAWGKIKSSTAVEHNNTPLQDKLDDMTQLIGYIGFGSAVLTFIALMIRYLASGADPDHAAEEIIHAFIIAVTIIVVAIPEGLPLAVTIALAYSTGKMYDDKCNIRHLAACETMGNATNICSDKTGTLTENQMNVVAGYFQGKYYDMDEYPSAVPKALTDEAKECIADNTSLNRDCHIRWHDESGVALFKPEITGSKTESALMLMAHDWGYDYLATLDKKFKVDHDQFFAFNSNKKRSCCVVHLPTGGVRLYVKGASEWIMKDCTSQTDPSGKTVPLSEKDKEPINGYIEDMAKQALRTLALAHVDFPDDGAMGNDWREDPPDSANLVLDCIVGIIDPLRSDVKDSVKKAQRAGVVVRMVTGDNITTAKAIARQCGILTDDGTAIEGPVFRKLTPAQADEQLLHIQVMARSSPEDKHLLVTRLNGGAVPADKEAWEKWHEGAGNVTWDEHKDTLLPGYKEEWNAAHPDGGDVVGVTGDGTNDAPALTAADVGLAMGITGTKVAQGAADIVILDDKFSSIVRAILWGRCVFDNIRKFLQFQITVNIVALIVVFIGAASGYGTPLTAVQMLWVNLIMDTLGALALGTEMPTDELLERKPYKRDASLISRPMWRNILVQSLYQLILLFVLMFSGAELFGVQDMKYKPCAEYSVDTGSSTVYTSSYDSSGITCSDFNRHCDGKGDECRVSYFTGTTNDPSLRFSYKDYSDFTDCLTCEQDDYTHNTIIFNAFIWCQIFNEYTARNLFDDVDCISGVITNPMFIGVSIFSALLQVLIVEFGADFTSTSSLTASQWGWTIFLGWGSMIFGIAQRFIPVTEDPDTFFHNNGPVRKDAPEVSKEGDGKGYELVNTA